MCGKENESKKLEEWYRHTVRQHNIKPYFKSEPGPATIQKEVHQKKCGDLYTVFIKPSSTEKERAQIHFFGQGCAVSQASASLMCQKLNQDPRAKKSEIENFLTLLLEVETPSEKLDHKEDYQKLLELMSVIPGRKGCVQLPWTALRDRQFMDLLYEDRQRIEE